MFLTALIPGDKSPGMKIDVYLQPLIDELKSLWQVGLRTYDVAKKNFFDMRAALMWTINDFPAYGMLSGWSTHGRLSCPVCMERTKAFQLKYSRKPSFFDCHRRFLPMDHCYRKNKKAFRKRHVEASLPPPILTGDQIWDRVRNFRRIVDNPSIEDKPEGYGETHNWDRRSIFWDLPYWRTHLLRHNIDVMHTERNVFMNIFNTVMDIKGKTKDTVKGRYDMEDLCLRPDLKIKTNQRGVSSKPKASFVLSKPQRLLICRWIANLKMPDGYVSNLSRFIDWSQAKLQEMKSHDCHIFMQRLLPIAFDVLPIKAQWTAFTELSQFFSNLTSKVLDYDKLKEMELAIPIILCKLEQFLPPRFFDSMEHLPVHLAYEARICGPVQYRWMYPFERFLKTLKDKVGNKARVEASICEAYLTEEATTFASYYFPSAEFPCRISRRGRIDDHDESSAISNADQISIFNYPGRPRGILKPEWLLDRDFNAAKLYILQNTDEVQK